MEVVEVDVVDPQPRQRLVEGFVDVLRIGFHDPVRFSMGETKHRGEEDLVAFSCLFEPM